ncbi:MAG: response regulator [Nanoarchaeota archaeon]|nr:response regulator [Nanoarchaeota archaeon]MBU1631672.1 response regulator [Nanoarchaeota archaeon]MBU1875642.1 response regulator [Nanoarchaeota archaeon]
MTEPKIYIVDDLEVVRKGIKKSLNLIGYHNLEEVTSGEEILDLLRNNSPVNNGCSDIIIMDTQMFPGKYGYDICSEIRQLYGSNVKIVGMSSDEVYESKWLEAGADYFFPKSGLCELKSFRDTIDSIVSK